MDNPIKHAVFMINSGLAITSTLVENPAPLQATAGVMVRPVNDTTMGIPFIATPQCYLVIACQWQAARQIDVVRHQQCVPAAQIQYETLMTRTIVIVRQQLRHSTACHHPLARALFDEGSFHLATAGPGTAGIVIRAGIEILPGKQPQYDQQRD